MQNINHILLNWMDGQVLEILVMKLVITGIYSLNYYFVDIAIFKFFIFLSSSRTSIILP